MSELKLSKRLEAIAKLVPLNGGVADVGTDHGYIPVWLSQNGHSGNIYATDINEGPIDHAKQTAREYDLEDRIHFFLCDGLEALNGNDVSTVITAGMGGENIADILQRASWTKDNNCLLILQPMSKSSYLRSWLYNNGYKVLKEQLVDDGTLYEVITACTGEDTPYSPAELLIGHNELISSDPSYRSRINLLIERAKKTESGLSSSSKAEDTERLHEIKILLTSFEELQRNV